MQQQRSDTVFLLTLVDFLVQIIFFGLFVFTVYAVVQQRNATRYSPAMVDRAVDAAGVSDLTELTDELSKLAPVRLKGFNSTLGPDPNGADVNRAAQAIQQAGGAKGLTDAMSRLAKLEKGSNLPPCISEIVDGKRRSVKLADAVGSGSTISFAAPTAPFTKLLGEVGLNYSNVQTLSLREFPRVFRRVTEKYPDCRFTITLRETTRMVDARDAAGQIFYTALRR